MRKTKIEAIKIIFIVKALTITIFSIAPIVESMKDLNMIDVLSVKIIKKKKLSKQIALFLALEDINLYLTFVIFIIYL